MIEYFFAFCLVVMTFLHAAFALDVYKSFFKFGKQAQSKYLKHFTDGDKFTRIFSLKSSTCFFVLLVGAMVVPYEDRYVFAALAMYMAVRVSIWQFFIKHQAIFQFKVTLK